ncbi:AraC family transcriptional regulator [Bordetella ansorpii]|uniref:AraC family transcriptional regulator n=1 Tax=Bordetella ansorpii TaxID=288768 RepID=A0A157QUV3_9BORD|nr:helix-turn-helix domain-containing protein [Bordetella ansorpii]SAI49561.1 AraC family transcriptional regulator [Bordetella ansorpii]
MRTVAVLVLPDFVPYDVGIACDVFSRVQLRDAQCAYRVMVCAQTAKVHAGPFDLHAPWRLDQVVQADVVIVPGIEDPFRSIPPSVVKALRAARQRGALIASICTGAFVLAAAGLLDGRRATTHWLAAGELARRYPAIDVDPGVLFVDQGDIVTSAGASAGLDMCLHLVRRHHGQSVASHSARLAVAPLHRDGGQAQFIPQSTPASAASLAPLFDWMLANLDQPIDVAALAARACMTPRTFARRFREQTGTTPIQWLLKSRVRRAQELLETSAATIDQIAYASGFDSPVTFRTRFQNLVGLTPSAYRRRFGGPAQEATTAQAAALAV